MPPKFFFRGHINFALSVRLSVRAPSFDIKGCKIMVHSVYTSLVGLYTSLVGLKLLVGCKNIACGVKKRLNLYKENPIMATRGEHPSVRPSTLLVSVQ